MHLNLHLKFDEILINLFPAYSLSGAICSMARSKWLANHPVSPWNLQTAQCFLSLMLLCTIVAFPRSHEYGANSKAGVAVDNRSKSIQSASPSSYSIKWHGCLNFLMVPSNQKHFGFIWEHKLKCSSNNAWVGSAPLSQWLGRSWPSSSGHATFA